MRFMNIKPYKQRLSSEHLHCLEFITKTKNWARNVNAIEVFNKLFEGHWEVTVIHTYSRSHSVFYNLIDSIPKFIISFTSKTFVLSFSPRISKSHNTIIFSITLDILAIKNCISVARKKTWKIYICFSSSNNCHSLICRVYKFIPNNAFILFIMLLFELIVVARSNWKCLKHLMRATSTNSSIRSFNFSPSFLKKHDPNLPSCSLTEDRSISISKNRNIVIDNYLCGYTCLHNNYFVNTMLIDFEVVVKNIIYPFLYLCQSSNGG